MYGGGILCGMAAFKQHASFGFWKHALVVGEGEPRDGMGSYGKLTSIKDLPPKKTAARAHPEGDAAQRGRREDAGRAQGRRAEAAAGGAGRPGRRAEEEREGAQGDFDAFPPSAQREYIEWIIEAKREETRAKRLAQAVEWMAEGKRRNWKYENC